MFLHGPSYCVHKSKGYILFSVVKNIQFIILLSLMSVQALKDNHPGELLNLPLR